MRSDFFGLIGGDCDELAGHESAPSCVEIEPATTDGLDPHRVLLELVGQVFELAGAPIAAIVVPDEDARRPAPQLRGERDVP